MKLPPFESFLLKRIKKYRKTMDRDSKQTKTMEHLSELNYIVKAIFI